MRTAGFLLFVLVWLSGLAAGALYFSTQDILPYHAQVMGGTVATLPPRVVTFYFGVVKVVGISQFVVAFLNAYLLFVRVRIGDSLAALVFVVANVGAGLGAAFVAYHLHQATGADTPWQLPLGAVAVLLLAYFLWLPSRA